jgi:hypothetical protein
MDIEVIAVVFNAPSWDDAAVWAEVFMRHVGDASKFSTTIVYASGTPGFIRNTVIEAARGTGFPMTCLRDGHKPSPDGKTCTECGATLADPDDFNSVSSPHHY